MGFEGLCAALAVVGVLILLGIWRAVGESARQQKRAADWLQFIANRKSATALQD